MSPKRWNGTQRPPPRGSADAQNNLGVLYKEGQGVPRDYAQAARWFTKAAERGNPRAQLNLAVLHDRGQGVPRDVAKARQWAEKAAAQGHANAWGFLGVYHLNGLGVPQDAQKAHVCFTVAAALGAHRFATMRDGLKKMLKPEHRRAAEQEAEAILAGLRGR